MWQAIIKAANWMRGVAVSEGGGKVTFTEEEEPSARDSSQSGSPEEIYKSVPWINAGVTAIVQNLAAVPLQVKVVVNEKTGTTEPAKDTWVNRLFEAPNHYQCWYDVQEVMFQQLELRGMGFLELVGSDLERVPPSKVFELRADRMEVVPDPKTRIAGYLYTSTPGEEPEFLPLLQVLYCKYANPTSEQEGLSPVDVAYRALELYDFADQAARNYYENGGTPEGTLETGQIMTEPMVRKVRRDWNRAYAGLGRHRTAVLQGGLKYVPIQSTIDTQGTWDTKKGVREEVLAILGVPPLIVGILDGMSYANARQQKMEFLDGTLRPKMRKFLGTFNRMVRRYSPNLVVEADFSELERAVEDKEHRIKERALSLKEVEDGCRSPNEYRRDVLGMEGYKGGDQIYMPTTAAPVGVSPQEEKSTFEQVIEDASDVEGVGSEPTDDPATGDAEEQAAGDQGAE